MNKQELIKKMAQEAGITQIQAKSALQSFEHGVTEALANGDDGRLWNVQADPATSTSNP